MASSVAGQLSSALVVMAVVEIRRLEVVAQSPGAEPLLVGTVMTRAVGTLVCVEEERCSPRGGEVHAS